MSLLTPTSRPISLARAARAKAKRGHIEIGLVNNMSDQALKVTERQFGSLVAEAAGDLEIRFRIFTFEGTRRSTWARDYIAANYEPASAIPRADLDGLIVTGAQPQADRLSDEPYWDELVELIDWAKGATASTILSCLAAHAGVLHLDGVRRRPLADKCTGVFAFTAKRSHALVGPKGSARSVPHSRHNGLLESELEQAGYSILSSSPARGVDTFIKNFGSQFVFLQGHPEYDANSLAREYRRDMDRYLRCETERKPARPKGYFAPRAEAELGEMERRAHGDRAAVRIDDLSVIDSLTPAEPAWRDGAVSFYRSWIEMIAIAAGRSRTASIRLQAPEFASS